MGIVTVSNNLPIDSLNAMYEYFDFMDLVGMCYSKGVSTYQVTKKDIIQEGSNTIEVFFTRDDDDKVKIKGITIHPINK